MGVKGLTALLQRLAPQSIRSQHISYYKGKTLAVDVSCFLNRFNPHPARVQRGVYRLCMYLQLNGIKPIFVFDGAKRIVEKQREIARRQATKERIEKSFKLEKDRKSILKDLKGSTKLLQKFSPETVSSILGDIQLQTNSPELAITSTSVDTSDKPEDDTSDDSCGNMDTKDSRVPQELISFESLNFQDESLENEPQWHIPILSEDERRQLDAHSEDFKSFISDQELFRPTSIGDYGSSEPIDHDMWSPDQNIEDLNELVDDLADYAGSNSLETSGDNNLPTSIESVIPAEEIARVYSMNPLDPSNDAQVRRIVHQALSKFVKSIESKYEGDTEEFENNATQRQKELNILEQELVQQIKEIARSNNAATENAEKGMSVQEMGDSGSAMLPLSPLETQVPQSGVLSTPIVSTLSESLSESLTESLSESLSKSLSGSLLDSHENIANEPSTTQGPPTSSTPTLAVGEGVRNLQREPDSMSKDPISVAIEGQDALPADTKNSEEIFEKNLSARDREVDVETGEKQDLQSMIKKVLSTHQTLLVTLERRTLRVTQPLSLSCQALLEAMGQPVVVASEAEAESVCARLTTLGIADASVSEDTDTAVFGDGLLLRQVGSSGDRDILEINPLVARKSLERVGPFKAVKLIQQYGSIESVLANISNQPRPDFMYDHARRVFDRVPSIPERPDAYLPKPEMHTLLQELMSKYEIVPEEFERELNQEMGVERAESSEDRDVFGNSLATNSLGADPFKASIVSIPETDKYDYHKFNKW
ncbi:Flap endonuclease GEN 1 [Haplosporangium sp. Z 27]|nr:Flap endonuclease GEN 1 [Haplosporangium sp. Z 27]